MARKRNTIGIYPPYTHEAGCTSCGHDGHVEQEYDLPDVWTSLLLVRVCEPLGVKSMLKSQRGSTCKVVLKAHDLATLKKIQDRFCDLYPAMNEALALAFDNYCGEHLSKKLSVE